MKRLSLMLILFMSLSCANVQEKLLPVFTVNIPPIKLRIPPLPIVPKQEVPVGALRSPINMDSTIRANTGGTFGAAAVHTVRVKQLVIKAMNADETTNLSSFESARIRIFSDTSSVDIANISFPASYTDSMVVVPSSTPDISKYLKGSVLSYNLYWKNRKPTKKALRLQIHIALNVQ